MTRPARNRKPRLSPAERHARFKELAREVGAEDEAPDFDGTVKRLASQPKPAKDDDRS